MYSILKLKHFLPLVLKSFMILHVLGKLVQIIHIIFIEVNLLILVDDKEQQIYVNKDINYVNIFIGHITILTLDLGFKK